MESSLFFGGSVIAAVVAGAIALFAPCCISFMLPAYFASAFQNRRLLVAMTFLFGAGVATVILPIALGASLLRQIFTEWHPFIYSTGGVILLGLAAYTLLGGQIHLPTPGARAGGRSGPLGVYSLGVFSGITSSCCAPVLAGMIALSSVAPSFAIALGLGTAYVFGMVAPLFALSLLWERFDWRSSKLLRPRTFTWQIGSIKRRLSGTQLASGVLLLILGVTMLWIGLTLKSMFRLTGWQASFAFQLQHIGSAITSFFTWIPNWAAAVLIIALVLLLARRAFRQVAPSTPSTSRPQPGMTQHDGAGDEEAPRYDDSLVSIEKGDKG
ncbi:MAG TPA: cytochrome c biogenesis protein CcdA [Ktedonobacterales bacterium]|nr:cytochrome c biogenesis protein CcdA [Ktedonobacterales bacterium]